MIGMFATEIGKKYKQLQRVIRGFDKVAVAFSGGIDSTFLLYAACDALGSNSVVALMGVSLFIPADVIQSASALFMRYFSGKARLRHIELFPLLWQEVMANNEDRCYFCKKRMYMIFQEEMIKNGALYLLDGTNIDDLNKKRPGIRAIRELDVQTPLLTAGFRKHEIRKMAKDTGLENHDLPSASCLATRIPTNIPIQETSLQLIQKAEIYLQQKGFLGCRVRPEITQTVIEVRTCDLERIISDRISILNYFQSVGLHNVVLNLHGRKEV
jgi:pyridinium-3,5-biscarboxylic acid mononucleotide sulfurtransferase